VPKRIARQAATGYNVEVFQPPSEMMIRISKATAMGLSGDREGARRALDQIWDEIGSDGDPLERVALAHSMADVQGEPLDELSWDLRALEAAGDVTDELMSVRGVAGSARGLYPSLHLNLADVYERLGKRHEAYEHIRRGRSMIDELREDGYKAMIRDALNRIEQRLKVY
jgi:hypothetical protein